MTETKKKGYKSIPLSTARKMLIAAVNCNKKNAIHCVTEIDISKPRETINIHFEKTGEKISFTAYIVKSLAKTLQEFPEMNSFLKGSRLIILDDITISVLVEREFQEEKIPEPLAIYSVQSKSVKQIHNEIRTAQKLEGKNLGDLNKFAWIRFIPRFLLKTFVKLADRNITMAKKYGKVAVTAVGMFSKNATWFIPHGTATVMLTVGGISKKPIEENGSLLNREFLSVTASFDHEIIDGAPAARFMTRFTEIMETADFLKIEI